MRVTLNGQTKEFPSSAQLHDIIRQFCQDTSPVIAEVNGDIVKRALWKEIQIKDGDAIELVSFVGGG